MKSSTVRRSMLSRESMDIIENIANNENSFSQEYCAEDNTPGEYLREEGSSSNISESKAREIDMLWQSFKTAQFNTNSPIMCFAGGVTAGIILTLAVMFLLGIFSNSGSVKGILPDNHPQTENSQTLENEVNSHSNDASLQILPGASETKEGVVSNESESVVSDKMVKYVIKEGDTVEAIIKKHYGAYSPERAEAIMKANNLKNLDRIGIDQVLLIPMDK